jgi:HEAT repeat protein
MTEIRDIIGIVCIDGPGAFDSYSPNRLADYYRNGESLRTLIPMLTHNDPEIASAGAWIASEVVDINNGREIFDELSQLLYHPDPAVRFWPISSVVYLADAGDTTELEQLFSLVADENIGVRNQALRYVCVIPESTLYGLKDKPIMRLLLRDVSKADILSECKSDDTFVRRLAIAGAIRNFSRDDNFLKEFMGVLSDDEKDEVAEIQRMTRNA